MTDLIAECDDSVLAQWRRKNLGYAADVVEAYRARLEQAEAALRPFAEKRNWHHNFDGTGIIFRIGNDPIATSYEGAIEAARAVLSAGEPE